MDGLSEQDDPRLAAALEDLGAPAVRAYAARLRELRPALWDRRGDYLSLRPAVNRPIAVYLHAKRVSIACEPSKAASLAWPGRKQKATPTTTYLILTADQLSETQDQAEALAVQALDWRSAGPAQAIGRARGQAKAPVEDVCPDCWCVISPASTCCCPE